MPTGRKYDHPPLFGPGAHRMSLEEVRSRATMRGTLPVHHPRQIIFQSLERLVQELLMCSLRCDVCVNGSFVTEKPEPDDVDATVVIDADVHAKLTDQQNTLVLALMSGEYIPGLDADAVVRYPRGHVRFTNEFINSGLHIGQRYGVENSGVWLKGYIVIRLGENNVGLRVHRW